MTSTSPEAAVQVWTKGFRVTQDSEEFQRVVPLELNVDGLERDLLTLPWGRSIEPLYGLTAKELSAQRAVLVAPEEVCAVCISRTEDKYGRPSVVVVTARTRIAWDDPGLGETVGRDVSLAARLANAYAEAFRLTPPNVDRQLRSGAFLSSRLFDLAAERATEGIDWDAVMRGVREWKGVRGVSTNRLLGLGANVVLGTRHEAEVASASNRIDGFYDVREKRIVPLGNALTPWHAPASTGGPPVAAALDTDQTAQWAELSSTVTRMEGTLARLADAILELCRVVVHRDDKGGKRK